MMRKLAYIAATGLIGSAVFLVVGFGLADQNQSVMSLWASTNSTCGPTNSTKTQTTLPFTATDNLTITVPATVQYVVGDTAEAIVSGNQALLEHVEFKDGKLQLDCDPGWMTSPLDITISSPAITTWTLLGSQQLTLPDLNQPRLTLNMRGSGSVTASGKADRVDLEISGSGSAKLKELTAQTAAIDIRGSGDAQITAKTDADVSISGSGNVALYGNPILRHQEIRGSGRIQQVR